jgi:hypothetical protein
MDEYDGWVFFFSFLLVILDGAREGEDKKNKKQERQGVLKNKMLRALLRRKNSTYNMPSNRLW